MLSVTRDVFHMLLIFNLLQTIFNNIHSRRRNCYVIWKNCNEALFHLALVMCQIVISSFSSTLLSDIWSLSGRARSVARWEGQSDPIEWVWHLEGSCSVGALIDWRSLNIWCCPPSQRGTLLERRLFFLQKWSFLSRVLHLLQQLLPIFRNRSTFVFLFLWFSSAFYHLLLMQCFCW